MTLLSNYSDARPVLTANAFRRRQLGKQLHRKAILHFWAVPFAFLPFVIIRSPLGMGAGVLLLAFAGWRYITIRRQMEFLRETPISLGASVVSKFRIKRSVYRIVMSYTFEGRTYSGRRQIDQAEHAAVLSREISLYALFDRRNPGKMLGYRAGSVIPRWLKRRSEDGVARTRVVQRPQFRQLGSAERVQVGIER